MQIALLAGVVAAVGLVVRRISRGASGSAIDVGAVSDRWVEENRAERQDGFH
jgi:hypothetical protein